VCIGSVAAAVWELGRLNNRERGERMIWLVSRLRRGYHAMVGVSGEIMVNSELGTVAAAAVARGRASKARPRACGTVLSLSLPWHA
jgi:hypothetical protein